MRNTVGDDVPGVDVASHRLDRHHKRTCSFSRVEDTIHSRNVKKRKADQSPEVRALKKSQTTKAIDLALEKVDRLVELISDAIIVDQSHHNLTSEIRTLLQTVKADDTLNKARQDRYALCKLKMEEELLHKIEAVEGYDGFKAISHLQWPKIALYKIGVTDANPLNKKTGDVACIPHPTLDPPDKGILKQFWIRYPELYLAGKVPGRCVAITQETTISTLDADETGQTRTAYKLLAVEEKDVFLALKELACFLTRNGIKEVTVVGGDLV